MRFRFNNLIKVSLLLFGMYFFYACKKDSIPPVDETTPYSETPYKLDYPYYFPKMSNIPLDNQLSVERTALGRKLYYDPILSNNGLSCSSCHFQSEAFSLSTTNAMPHINLGFNNHFLWNGKISGTVEEIMKFEVDEFFSTDISKLNASEAYRKEFKRAYNVTDITSKEVTYALAQFFRALISKDSKFDKFFMHEADLTSPEIKGYVIFNTEKGDCFHCHSVGLFTDNIFHNIGIDSVFDGVDRGRFNYTGNAADMGLFKTPTLRNIEMTAPYMHDGRFKTLEEVVEFYNSGVKLSPTIDPVMTKDGKQFGLKLTTQEKSELVAFLKTLTDSTFLHNPAFAKP